MKNSHDIFIKITPGFVHQTFKKSRDGKHICVDQAFIAGDEYSHEDVDGEPLKVVPEYKYEPYEMNKPPAAQKFKYLLYNDVLGSMASEEPLEADSLEDALTEVLRSMGYSIIEAVKREDE